MGLSFRRRALIKFVFWALSTAVVFGYAISTYRSGQMVHWYYFKAKADGYALNTRLVARATPQKPATLAVGTFEDVKGLRAVPVKRGDVLPEGATGVIDLATITEGRRARISGSSLIVMIPWQLVESKGFMYRDEFTRQNVQTNPRSGVWNVLMIVAMGLSLGYLAEGFTELLGLRLKKIDHSVGH
jgi:hypothetical protein